MLSIRFRLLIGMAIALIPLLVLGIGSFYYLLNALHGLDEVMEEAFEEAIPIMRLENLIARSAMPANDYLVHGNLRERKEFDLVEQKTQKAFSQILLEKFDLSEEETLLHEAYEEWQRGRQLSRWVLALDDPEAVPGTTEKMEEMDAAYDSALNKVGSLIKTMIREAGDHAEQAHQTLEKLIRLILTTFCVGLILLLFVGVGISRSILQPFALFQQGVRRFGEGDFLTKVDVQADDEIGELADVFNQMSDRIREFATRDGLTGMLDRREFDRRIHEELQRARRYKHTLGLLMIDLDHFKAVNDDYGHQAGDSVLIGVTERIAEMLRPVDKIARYGGEEIVVILPETDLEGTAAAAERIRRAIADEPFTTDDDRDIRVTVSIGAAVYPNNAFNEKSLIEEADAALYRAKAHGRNRVDCSETFSEQSVKSEE